MSDDETAKADPAADPKTITGEASSSAGKPADPLKQHAQTERKFEA